MCVPSHDKVEKKRYITIYTLMHSQNIVNINYMIILT